MLSRLTIAAKPRLGELLATFRIQSISSVQSIVMHPSAKLFFRDQTLLAQ